MTRRVAPTARRRRTQAPADTEAAIYRQLAESSQDFLYLVGPDLRLRFVNPVGAAWLRSRPELLIGRPIAELFPATAERQAASLRQVLDSGEPLFVEYPYFIGQQEYWLNARLSPVRDAAGRVIAVAGTSIDITARRRMEQELQRAQAELEARVAERTAELRRVNQSLAAESAERQRVAAALQASEERFRRFFESNPALMSINDEQMRFLEVNQAFLDTLGWTRAEVLGDDPVALGLHQLGPRRDGLLARLRQEGRLRGIELDVHGRDGVVRHGVFAIELVEVGGQRLYFVTMDDVTERRRLERQVQQAQKLESLGVMAGGIAHDFNNILSAVLGHAELAQLSLPQAEPVRRHLEQIRTAVFRLTELTNQMLAYAGKSRFAISAVDLSGAVRDILELVGASLPKKVAIRLELADDLPAIEADPSQIRQVAANLISNAAEAIGDFPGTVTVRTALVELEGRDLLSVFHEPILPGRYVQLSVSDTGQGIAPQALGQIFDPFFTTKFTGRGLGLAVVAGIVRAHGGRLRVTSTVGLGSTFEVLLPPAPHPDRPAAAPDGPGSAGPGTQGRAHPDGGADHVLLVDDDEHVRQVVACFLQQAGFAVTEASDGPTALRLLREAAGPCSLVLLDQTMPILDGIETAAAIRAAGLTLPIVLSSGYPLDLQAPQLRELGLAGFIQKPYQHQALIDLLRAVLHPADRA